GCGRTFLCPWRLSKQITGKETIMIRVALLVAAFALVFGLKAVAADDKEEGFVTIFDGKSLDGWKVGGDPDTFKLKNGEVVANGKVSHLYYVGDPKPFKNFELRVDVMTEPN